MRIMYPCVALSALDLGDLLRDRSRKPTTSVKVFYPSFSRDPAKVPTDSSTDQSRAPVSCRYRVRHQDQAPRQVQERRPKSTVHRHHHPGTGSDRYDFFEGIRPFFEKLSLFRCFSPQKYFPGPRFVCACLVFVVFVAHQDKRTTHVFPTHHIIFLQPFVPRFNASFCFSGAPRLSHQGLRFRSTRSTGER